MAIEIVNLPIDSMVIFHSYVSLPEGNRENDDSPPDRFRGFLFSDHLNIQLSTTEFFRSSYNSELLSHASGSSHKVGTRSKTTSGVVQICPSPRRRCARRGAVGRRGPVVGCYASEGDVFLRDVASMNVPFPLVGWLVESSLHSTNR